MRAHPLFVTNSSTLSISFNSICSIRCLTIYKPPNTTSSVPQNPQFSLDLPKSATVMADYRSKPYNYTDQDMQLERYTGEFDPKMPDFNHHPSPPRDFRSYSVSYKIPQNNTDIVVNNDLKLKKVKSTNGSWSFGDPEFQRKKRVAGYKVYSVEGKLKGSFRKSFRWIKDKYMNVVYG
ncbi:hypothetical protein L1987_14464 [Smallanthus sonchifolius]|uniref:Uncharacterized protein n=1 Tax=Smallanthus sonchifolius TaxID=185202 RepID=A0ACB9J3Q6_9ASTR|nr:hypothetical protein L1987_14464 [Smallanthus sonchifolius]